MRNALATLVAAAMLGPAATYAQPANPTIYCSAAPGQCFAMEFVSSGTSSTLFLQNLQGSFGAAATPFSLAEMWVDRVNTGANAGTRMDFFSTCGLQGTVGAVAYVNGARSFCWGEGSTGEWMPAPPTQGRHYSGIVYGEGRLTGCDAIGLPAVSTCPRDGLDGWAELRFVTGIYDVSDPRNITFHRPLTLDDVRLRIGPCTIGGARSGLAPAEPTCLALPYATLTTVPEPATWATLGAGLLALGAVVRRRRARRL